MNGTLWDIRLTFFDAFKNVSLHQCTQLFITKIMKKKMDYELSGEYIELIKVLKFMRFAESGAHAKIRVEEGSVKLNGIVEYRKRAKLRPGDIIEIDGNNIHIIKESES
jgi:ribosome-associated protein